MRNLGPVALSFLLAAGCSGPEQKVVPHPVSGRVMYDGQPAAGVEVTLIPTDAPMVPLIPRNPRGVTGPDGKFHISTFSDGDGAAEGGYQIVLFWPAAKKTGEDEYLEEMDSDRLLGWYDGTHSNLTIRVKPGPNEIPVLNLPRVVKPPPESQGVPGRN